MYIVLGKTISGYATQMFCLYWSCQLFQTIRKIPQAKKSCHMTQDSCVYWIFTQNLLDKYRNGTEHSQILRPN